MKYSFDPLSMNGERLPTLPNRAPSRFYGYLKSIWDKFIAITGTPRATTQFLPPFLADVFKCKLLEFTCHIVWALFAWRGPVLFCCCVDDVSIWWQMFNFLLLSQKRWFQFIATIVRTDFVSVTRLNNWEMIAETQSYIFTWRSRCHRRRVCLGSLIGQRHIKWQLCVRWSVLRLFSPSRPCHHTK